MKHVSEQKIQAWKEHHERFACDCDLKLLRKRLIKGGAVQYVYQCQRCGEVSLQAVSRAKAFELFGGNEPPPLDTLLREEWNRKKKEAGSSIEKQATTRFWCGYSEYLASPEWAARRRLVLVRAAGTCEGCGSAPPSEVHHLTYEHLGEEFLFELTAVCSTCHVRLHAQREEDE